MDYRSSQAGAPQGLEISYMTGHMTWDTTYVIPGDYSVQVVVEDAFTGIRVSQRETVRKGGRESSRERGRDREREIEREKKGGRERLDIHTDCIVTVSSFLRLPLSCIFKWFHPVLHPTNHQSSSYPHLSFPSILSMSLLVMWHHTTSVSTTPTAYWESVLAQSYHFLKGRGLMGMVH